MIHLWSFCIMDEYSPEEYTRFYIVQALFKLMNEYEFEKISVTDVAQKAGVGRATFYRYFKRKEDVIIYYFDHNSKAFIVGRRYYPRCKEDYFDIVKSVFTMFKENKEPLKLIRRARLEYLYLDYLNRRFLETFSEEFPQRNPFLPYAYSGMLFNMSMAWLDGDCKEEIDDLARTLVDAIYFGK